MFFSAGMETQSVSNASNVWHVWPLSHPYKMSMWLLLPDSNFPWNVFGSQLCLILSLYLCKASCQHPCECKPNDMTAEFTMLTYTAELPVHLQANAAGTCSNLRLLTHVWKMYPQEGTCCVCEDPAVSSQRQKSAHPLVKQQHNHLFISAFLRSQIWNNLSSKPWKTCCLGMEGKGLGVHDSCWHNFCIAFSYKIRLALFNTL